MAEHDKGGPQLPTLAEPALRVCSSAASGCPTGVGWGGAARRLERDGPVPRAARARREGPPGHGRPGREACWEL